MPSSSSPRLGANGRALAPRIWWSLMSPARLMPGRAGAEDQVWRPGLATRRMLHQRATCPRWRTARILTAQAASKANKQHSCGRARWQQAIGQPAVRGLRHRGWRREYDRTHQGKHWQNLMQGTGRFSSCCSKWVLRACALVAWIPSPLSARLACVRRTARHRATCRRAVSSSSSSSSSGGTSQLHPWRSGWQHFAVAAAAAAAFRQ